MRRALLWILVLALIAGGVWFTQFRPIERRMKVYFIGPVDGVQTLVEVERKMDGRRPELLLRGAIEALLAGPATEEHAKGLSTEIPPGTRLRSLTVRDGIALVDLTAAIATGGGSTSMQARLWQIVYTGTQLPAVAQQVRLLIEGQESQALGGEGVIIEKPIGRAPAFPRF
jgi:spore germination protein GerM